MVLRNHYVSVQINGIQSSAGYCASFGNRMRYQRVDSTQGNVSCVIIWFINTV